MAHFSDAIKLEEGEFVREDGKEWTIPLLLEESVRIRPTLPVLFPWEVLRYHISISDMATLRRHSQLEKLYFCLFNPLVKKEYGSAEAFLRIQLGWKEVVIPGPDEYWTREKESVVRKNDWCYSVEMDVTHWVVWVKLPLVHPLLCSSSYPTPSPTPTSTPTSHLSPTWENVQKVGLCGFTGTPASSDQLHGFGGGDDEPGREVAGFIKDRWKEDEFETCWFVNPPWLQSVRGLSHFHVMSRPKQKG